MEIPIKYKEGDKVYEIFLGDIREYTVKEFLGISYTARAESQKSIITYLVTYSEYKNDIIKQEHELYSTYEEALDALADKNAKDLPTNPKIGKLIIEKYTKLLGL